MLVGESLPEAARGLPCVMLTIEGPPVADSSNFT